MQPPEQLAKLPNRPKSPWHSFERDELRRMTVVRSISTIANGPVRIIAVGVMPPQEMVTPGC